MFLTHRGHNTLHAIMQKTFSNSFPSMNIAPFDTISPKFIPTGSVRYNNIGSDYGLAPSRRHAISWINDCLVTDAYMRHSALMS